MTVDSDKQKARVLPFRRRNRVDDQRDRQALSGPAGREIPAAGLERYERPEGTDDDYRHRMIVNCAGLIFCVLLGAAGIWVAITLADARRNQDCVLAGRRNCAGLSIPSGAGVIREDQAAPKTLLPK